MPFRRPRLSGGGRPFRQLRLQLARYVVAK